MTEFVATSTLLTPRPAEGSKDTTMVVNMGPQHPSTHGVLAPGGRDRRRDSA